MRKLIPFDVETTTLDKGSPYNKDNKLVSVGLGYETWYKEFNTKYIQRVVDRYTLVGHNIKFDIAWLRRIGITFDKSIVRDTQLAEFIISNQTHAFSSLNELAFKYLGKEKLDIVKTEYWDKGIDTWFIPQDILLEYLQKDLELTLKVYNKQEKILKETGKWQLYLLQCADLLVLQEMEWNGILYDKETSVAKGNELQQGIDTLTKSITINSPCPTFNVGSGDHLSCLLYGGTIKEDVRVPVGVYKTGPKIGQTRFSIRKEEYKHEQLIKPLKGSALKKEGYYSTDEGTLKSLKGSKKVNTLIYSILKLSKLLKLQGTYFFGIPKLMDKMHWDDNYIHGQLNQCIARTGRLSASEPNQQNMDPQVKQLCISRYTVDKEINRLIEFVNSQRDGDDFIGHRN